MNRSRAAAISRLLLCEDILERPVTFSTLDLQDIGSDDPLAATRSNDACLACHASLDPMAASLFGFWWLSLYSTIEETNYHPEREPLGEVYLETEMAYYGTPVSGLRNLAEELADDPRLYRCATQTFAKALWRRELSSADEQALKHSWEVFLQADARINPLVQHLLNVPEYRTGSFTDSPTPTQQQRYGGLRMMSADQLRSSIADLTGFVWQEDGFDQLRNDDIGHRALAGGVDGLNTSAPQRQPSPTIGLVHAWPRAAAWWSSS